MTRLRATVLGMCWLALSGCGYYFDVLEESSSPSGRSAVRVLLGGRPILPYQKWVVRVEVDNPHSVDPVVLSDRFKNNKSDPGLYCNGRDIEIRWSEDEDVVAIRVDCYAASGIQIGYQLTTDRILVGREIEAGIAKPHSE